MGAFAAFAHRRALGKKRENPVRRSRAGFTLLEIVVVLAIIGLVSTVALMNFDGLFGGFGQRPPEDVLHTAVRQARYEAAMRMCRTFLTFDEERNAFVLVDQNGENCGIFSLGDKEKFGRFEIEFIPVLPTETVHGKDDDEPSKYPVERLSFDPNGCALPVVVHIRGGDAPQEIRLDPFYWGPPPERDLKYF